MNRVETEYQKKLRVKKVQQAAFRRFLRGQGTPIKIRDWIGLNWQEVKVLLESRMQPTMSWQNYGTHWVVDHVVPFWLFDVHDEMEMKLLWHPDNLLPLIWKDNNHKQGDLRFALLLLTRRKGSSFTTERLIERLEREIKVQDKYLPT
jgi:hypothetical protein